MPINQYKVIPAIHLLLPDLRAEDERISDRTLRGKIYQLPGGNRKLVTGISVVHYKDNPNDDREVFKEVDLTIGADGKCGKCKYDFEALKDRPGYSYLSKTGDRVEVDIAELDDTVPDYSNMTMRREGHEWFWENVSTDFDVYISLRPQKVTLWKKLKSASAPRKIKWRNKKWKGTVGEFLGKTEGEDSTPIKARALELMHSTIQGIGTVDYDVSYFTEEWTGRVGEVINKATRQKDWTTNVTYPVIIDDDFPIINNDLNDVYSKDGAGAIIAHSGGDQIFANYNGNLYNAGWRFEDVNIEKDSTINSADQVIKVITSNYGASLCLLKMEQGVGEVGSVFSTGNRPVNINSPVQFATPTFNGTATHTLDCGVEVQALIDHADWVANDNIRVWGDPSSASAGRWQQLGDYNGGGGEESKLVIDFTPPAVGGAGILNPAMRRNQMRHLLNR